MVRIPAFHVGGPGSIPGVGTSFCQFFSNIIVIVTRYYDLLYFYITLQFFVDLSENLQIQKNCKLVSKLFIQLLP